MPLTPGAWQLCSPAHQQHGAQDCQLPRHTSTLHITNAKCLEGTVLLCFCCKSRGTPKTPLLSSRKGQLASGVRRWLKTRDSCQTTLLLLLPHRLQEVTGAAYASDSSPPCMVPSSSDMSFRSINFPSFVNGTDFISWANAAGSWRKRREVSKLQQPLRNTHFPVLLAKLLQLPFFFLTSFRIKIWNINNTFWLSKNNPWIFKKKKIFLSLYFAVL